MRHGPEDPPLDDNSGPLFGGQPKPAPLFDAEASKGGRDEGIKRAYEAAEEAWKGRALSAAHEVCKAHHDFLVDEVWRALGGDRPEEGRSMAGVLDKAAARGWCEKTKEWRPTTMVQRHRAPCMVWRSLIHRNGAP